MRLAKHKRLLLLAKKRATMAHLMAGTQATHATMRAAQTKNVTAVRSPVRKRGC